MRATMITALTVAALAIPAIGHADEADAGGSMSTCGAYDPRFQTGVPVLDRAIRGALGAVGAATPCPKNYDTKLPKAVSDMLASKDMREMHYKWHLVRDNWNDIPKATQDKLAKAGWKPPRLAGDPGSGKDFICMHHQMIKMVNDSLKKSGDACYKEVKGWNPIPWSPTNKAWPMPKAAPGEDAPDYKLPAETAKYKKLVETEYTKDAWLKKQSIDSLGLEFERGIHGWMHMHWSGTGKDEPADPMKCTTADSPCDWLGSPYTAHVNPVFWKLHGWIEAEAERVAALNGTTLDKECEGAFSGPPMHHPMPMGHDMGGMRGMPGMDGASGDDFGDIVKSLPDSMTKDFHF